MAQDFYIAPKRMVSKKQQISEKKTITTRIRRYYES